MDESGSGLCVGAQLKPIVVVESIVFSVGALRLNANGATGAAFILK